MANRVESIERLEPRRLFAGVLAVNGTAGNDTILIKQEFGNYNVSINGAEQNYDPEVVVGFNVFCGDGDDILIVTNDPRGLYADGGNGNDRMVGSDGPDTFLGAAGKDQLYGAGGNDRINGAGGNDKVFGDAGADRMYGGDGNDYVDGGSSADRMYPGGGVDAVYGQGGNDIMFCIDSVADQLFGGSGIDTAHVDGADARASIEQVVLS
jgi:Ca2+-binding RTX toxin-like protein